MQKKFTILPFIVFILSFFSYISAGAPDTLWTRTYGGTQSDFGYSVQQTSDGGFIIAGYTNSFGVGWSDAYLIRTDPNGDTLWTKTYGEEKNDYSYSVLQTKDNGYIITGTQYVPGGSESDCRLFLVKYSTSGDTLWSRKFGDITNSQGEWVTETTDEGFIITGCTNPIIGTQNYDVYLIRTNSGGDTLWTRAYGGISNDFGYSVKQTIDGGFVIIGSTRSFGVGWEDVYLIRTNSNGDTLWTKSYGGIYLDEGYSVQLTNGDGFIIAGTTESFRAGKYDSYVIRTDSKGGTLWTKTYGGSYNDGVGSIQQLSNGGFIMTGYTESFGDSLSDVYLIRTDSNGDTLWTKTYGGIHKDGGSSIQQTNDGGFIIVGGTWSFGAGECDVYLIRLDTTTIGIQKDNPANFIKQYNFIVFYNYGNNLIYIRYTIPYSSSVKLKAYDIKGKLVKVIRDKFMQKGSYSVNWDSKRFGSGVYFVRLRVNGSEVSRKVTVVR